MPNRTSRTAARILLIALNLAFIAVMLRWLFRIWGSDSVLDHLAFIATALLGDLLLAFLDAFSRIFIERTEHA